MADFPRHPTEGPDRLRASVAVARAATRLATAGIGPARAEAEQLAAYVLGVSRGRLALVDGFGAAQLHRFEELVARRA
ncbi:peptide chain release factor N(5)-glutamine methyltransferase, partial [Micromonospora zhanjiangensis]